MDGPYRVLIADDHALMRAGLKALINQTKAFVVESEAENGQEAIRLAVDTQPDLILLDISMPLTNGTEAIAAIRRRCPCCHILMVTAHSTDEFVRESLRLGANGYLLKEDSPEELIFAMHTLMADKTYLSPTICSAVVNGYLQNKAPDKKPYTGWESLTRRERETLKLIAEGYRNREIAQYLNLSHKTIEKHRANLMTKLDIHSAPALIAYAIENGVAGN